MKIATGFGHIVSFGGVDVVHNPSVITLANIDPDHTGNVLRTRLYDTTNIMQIGDFPALVADLQLIVNSPHYSKLDHKLNPSDVENNDRSHDKMNKQCTWRVCSAEVINILTDQGMHGTAWYLNLVRCFLDASKNPTISDSERLHKLRFVTSCLRRWRNSIEEKKGTAKDFITSAAWEAIEVELVVCIRLVTEGIGSLLVKLNSQANEQLFGAMRSSSTQGQFGVNFTPKEAMNIINNGQILQHLQSKLCDTFMFPSVSQFKGEPYVQQTALSIDEITAVLEAADHDAIDACKLVGIESDEVQIDRYFSPFSFDASLLRENLSDSDETEAVNCDVHSKTDVKVVSYRNCHFIDDESDDAYFKSIQTPTQLTPFELTTKSSFLYILNKKAKSLSTDKNAS
jgi:hypothetical protein